MLIIEGKNVITITIHIHLELKNKGFFCINTPKPITTNKIEMM